MRRLSRWVAAALLPLTLAGCPEWFEKPEPPERTAPKPKLACQPNCAGAYLVEANLVAASLANSDFTNARFDGANLRGADLRNTVLVGATLRGADLSGAQLTDADLTDADLSGATLRGADLTRATVRDAILAGAELTGADLTGADLQGANLEGADLTAVQGCDVSRRLPRCRAAEGSHEHLASGAAFEAFLRDGTMDTFTAGAVEAVEAAIPEEEREAFVAELNRINLRGNVSALMANRSFRRLLEITAPYYDARYGGERRMQGASVAAADTDPYDPFEEYGEELTSYLRRWLGGAKEKVDRALNGVFGQAIGGRSVVSVCARAVHPLSSWRCAAAVGAYIGWNIQGNKPEADPNVNARDFDLPDGPARQFNYWATGAAPCCEQNTALDNRKPRFPGGARIPSPTYEVGQLVSLSLPAATGGDGTLKYRLDAADADPYVFDSGTYREPVPGLDSYLLPNATVDDPDKAGRLSGQPTTAGVYPVTLRVFDRDEDRDRLDFTITVNEAAAPLAFRISVGPQSYTVGTEIDVLPLPEATGGVAPRTYRLRPDVPGLTFDENARTLSGTPTTAGSYPMTYTATDANGATAVLRFVITVEQESSTSLAFRAPVTDKSYVVGTFMVLDLPEATGGTAPLRYTLAPDIPGLTFVVSCPTQSVGTVCTLTSPRIVRIQRWLFGTPTRAGTYPMTYTATDAAGDTAVRTFTITVTEPAVPDEPTFDRPVSAQTYTRGVAITPLVLPNATGGTPPLKYELSSRPRVPGLRWYYDPNSGKRTLEGTPTEVGEYRMTYEVTDADGDKDELRFTITVTESTGPVDPPELPGPVDPVPPRSVPDGTAFDISRFGTGGIHGFTCGVNYWNVCYEVNSNDRSALDRVRPSWSGKGIVCSDEANGCPGGHVCRRYSRGYSRVHSQQNRDVVVTQFDYWSLIENPVGRCEDPQNHSYTDPWWEQGGGGVYLGYQDPE